MSTGTIVAINPQRGAFIVRIDGGEPLHPSRMAC